MEATIHVFTYREGLLSNLGHDLRLTISRFRIEVRGNEVIATFDPSSLTVDGAVVSGRVDGAKLSDADKQKIHDIICQQVLRSKEHPEVRLSARVGTKSAPFRIDGSLTLCGTTRRVAVVLQEEGKRLRGSIELCPSQWGVKPFRALGGTLKVKDKVLVVLDVSADWLLTGAEPNPAVQLVWAPRERPSVYPRAQTRDAFGRREPPLGDGASRDP
jgi:hypothetical protein